VADPHLCAELGAWPAAGIAWRRLDNAPAAGSGARNGVTAMKRTYEKPTLTKREKLSSVASQAVSLID